MGRVAVSQDTIDWLLAEDNPPVRYLTLTQLLDRSQRARAVRETKARIGEYGPTRKILARRKTFWREGAALYQKYRGGYWQLIFLGELLAPRSLPGVEDGVEFVLAHQNWPWMSSPWWGIHCLNANLLRAMVALGYGRDRRVREGLEHVAREVLEAKGVPCFIIDWSPLSTCSMSLPKVLLALTSLSPAQRTPTMRRAVRVCRERLLEQHVSRYVPSFREEWREEVRRSPEIPSSISRNPEKRRRVVAAKERFITARGGFGERLEKQGWRRFGFPLHYNSDILEAMRSLVQAGAPKRSPRVRSALEHILECRTRDGRWKLRHSWNGKMIANVERKGQPSRWITFQALWVLRYFRGLEIEGRR